MPLLPLALRRIAAAARTIPCLLLALACLGAPDAGAQGNLAPTITSFSPQSGAVGATVTITGTNFTTPVTASFGGNAPANITFTATQITATVPNGAVTGPITVVNSSGVAATTAANFTVGTFAPNVTSSTTALGTINLPFSYQITADATVTAYAASGLPNGLTLDPATGLISGRPSATGTTNAVLTVANTVGSTRAALKFTISSSPLSSFFLGQVALSSGAYYLAFSASSLPFGYYVYLTDPSYIFHFDLGYEYVFNADDGFNGAYFYDFTSGGFFYTSPYFPFPYLYDFRLGSTVYYYPDPSAPGRYNTDGVRYFYVFNTRQIISK